MKIPSEILLRNLLISFIITFVLSFAAPFFPPPIREYCFIIMIVLFSVSAVLVIMLTSRLVKLRRELNKELEHLTFFAKRAGIEISEQKRKRSLFKWPFVLCYISVLLSTLNVMHIFGRLHNAVVLVTFILPIPLLLKNIKELKKMNKGLQERLFTPEQEQIIDNYIREETKRHLERNN